VSVGTAQIVDTPIPEDPVAIDSGAVSRKTLPSGVTAYFGIPYAATPLRDLRWHEPQPVQAWKGVYHADRMASERIQVLRRHNLNHYFGEDCLKALGAGSLAEMRLSPRAKERPRPAPETGRWHSSRPARLRSSWICFRAFSSRDPVSASPEYAQA
jgi:carboxylesterase family protein